jgi:hydroxyacylglutathione hydrolase
VVPATHAAWTEVAEGVRVRRSVEYAMNSGVLLDSEHTVVIDPGVLPSEIDDIAKVVAAASPARISLFLTHGHWDHVLARPWWPRDEVIAHDMFAAEITRDLAHVREEAVRVASAHGESWAQPFAPFRPSHSVSGLHYTRRGRWHLVFRDAFGHSPSQLTLHLPDLRVLFAADMLSDIEVPGLEGPPETYRVTLETLRPLAEHGAIETLVPGHGAIARGRDEVMRRLERDLGYLAELDRRADAAARAGGAAANHAFASMDITPWGVSDYNTHTHAENIRLALAARGVSPKS